MDNSFTELGLLNEKEISKFKRSLIKSGIKENLNRIITKIGLKSYAKFNFKDIDVPDSKLVHLAIEEAHDIYNPVLLKHCYRTFFWSAGIAVSEGIKHDNELLFISSILHDSGLTDKHNHCCSQQCFANYGGDFAKKFVINNGMNINDANIIKEAIDMHLNPTVNKVKYGNEAYLLSKGASMDVIGSHYFQLPIEFIRTTHKNYSRVDFKEDILKTIQQLNHKENTRASIMSKMGFDKLANKNILDTHL